MGMYLISSKPGKINGKRHGARIKNIFIKGGAKISQGLKHESTCGVVAVEQLTQFNLL